LRDKRHDVEFIVSASQNSLSAVCSLQGEFPDDDGAGHHQNMSEYGEL
jgi:hypothetical protein